MLPDDARAKYDHGFYFFFERRTNQGRYHASGVEALSFFRGEIDASRPELIRASHALERVSLAVIALFIFLAAVLVVALGERLRGRKNGILQCAF